MSDKLMDRIQKLLNQANDVGLDTPEGKAFAAKAEQMMHQHKIDEIMLRIRSAGRLAAEKRGKEPADEIMGWVTRGDEFRDYHERMVSWQAALAGVMLVYRGYDELHVIGYPEDIQYFRMMWVSTHLTFSGKLFPEWSPEKDAGDNIRALAEAGYKWLYIWRAAQRAGFPLTKKDGSLVPAPPEDNGWMKREMAKSYKRDGVEKPKLTHQVKDYRASYAAGFVETIRDRITNMIWERRTRENAAGDGVSLVLKKDADAIKDHFNRLYPPGSTTMREDQPKLGGKHDAAVQRGRAAANSVDFSGGTRGMESQEERQALS